MRPTQKIICQACKKSFLPKSEKNIFCSRKCFKKAYYHRMKGEEIADLKKFPTFLCPSCGTSITLDFDPVKNSQKWLHYSCPGCNTMMINVSDLINTKDSPKT